MSDGRPLASASIGSPSSRCCGLTVRFPTWMTNAFFGRRLRQVVAQPLGEARPLALQVGHEREHRHRVPARRMRLGVKHHLLARLDERLLRERASEELGDGIGDLVPRPAEPRVVGVARLGQRGGGRLPHDATRPRLRVHVRLDHLLELEQKRRILVAAEQPEQHPVGQLERPAGAGPLELKQAAVLGDRPHVLDALRGRRCQPQQVTPRRRCPSASSPPPGQSSTRPRPGGRQREPPGRHIREAPTR